MKESKFNEEQIIAILREAERGEQTIAAVCRAHSMMKQEVYWRATRMGRRMRD